MGELSCVDWAAPFPAAYLLMKTPKPWRDLYITLLKDGPRDAEKLSPEDRQLQREMARELIESGNANGYIVRSPGSEVAGFTWIGPTVEGRLFAEKLIEEKRRESWGYRFRQAVIVVIGWLAGILSSWLSGVFSG